MKIILKFVLIPKIKFLLLLYSTYCEMNCSLQQDCEYDSIRVSSGVGRDSVIHGIYCGSTLPSSITSESNTLRIEFNSDNSVQKTGFHAHFFTGKQMIIKLSPSLVIMMMLMLLMMIMMMMMMMMIALDIFFLFKVNKSKICFKSINR